MANMRKAIARGIIAQTQAKTRGFIKQIKLKKSTKAGRKRRATLAGQLKKKTFGGLV